MLAEEPYCCVRGCNLPSTTVDHVIPLSRGGARTDRANLRGMCGPHNYSKGNKLSIEMRTRASKPAEPKRAECEYCRNRNEDGSVEEHFCPGVGWFL